VTTEELARAILSRIQNTAKATERRAWIRHGVHRLRPYVPLANLVTGWLRKAFRQLVRRTARIGEPFH